ncbi:hypothetical protein B0J12DRAFT_238520 [Macrophomina phaseolina]|uniref:Uncharacterized protein n=1 Tax=Macrophomina phaseolina TaxID=35725 RepID=A0ABQ8GQJ2_9PEZI|nr:hypothetical protein B0J12DRAFT_238520 [Macrophomina phaseolina]
MPSARTKRYRARVERRYGQRALNSKQESGQDGTPKPDPDGAFSDNAPIDDISFNMEAEESVDDVSHETSTFRESSASPSENTEYKGRKRTVHHRAHHSRAQTKRRCVKYTERQLNVLWPPSEREPIETLYHWKILCSPQERAERAPYCFRPSDGQPRAYFERLFKAFEARRLAAAQQQNSSSGTPPSTTSHEHALTPAFPLLLTARSEGLEGSRPRYALSNVSHASRTDAIPQTLFSQQHTCSISQVERERCATVRQL